MRIYICLFPRLGRESGRRRGREPSLEDGEKKRSDANQPKKPKHSSRKYFITVAAVVAIIVVVVVLYFLFPELFN